ncbi:hypothetical protein U5801_21640 [Lamprobacter modestohalophilus]|uniref:hypothetical protein n=1 Tax=Lamprobacter modestohalophilus TaxID=1064514 RepID=UPI002ADEA7EB|nr:hypothetical protein [Lamprobacter modestohalophilus]MEA1052388.1 hypothetical protein [Lamprobacter modestohalophilus]
MSPSVYPRRQRGVATLLLVVLMGLGLTAATLAGIHRLQSSQELNLSLHAQTVAQKRAWLGAEAFAEFLRTVTDNWDSFMSALATDDEAAVTVVDEDAAAVPGFSLVVRGINVPDPTANPVLVWAQIVSSAAAGSRAEARAILEVVYAVSFSSSAARSRAVMDFYNGLDITGDIDVSPEPDETYDINVDGNVNISNVSVTGIDIVKSTKSIRFQGGSSSDIKQLHSNCDVMVSNAGGFEVEAVKATNNACITNTASTELVQANGSVEVAGGLHGTLYARADVDPGIASCASDSEVHCSIASDFGVKVNWTTPVRIGIFTKGDVYTNTFVNTLTVQTEGNFISDSCPGTSALASVRLGGELDLPSWCSTVYTISSDPVVVPTVPPVTMERESFDANSLRDMANYIFLRYDGGTRVKVQNVNGMPAHDQSDNPISVREHGYYYRSANIIDPSNPYWTSRMVSNYACVTASSSSDDPDDCWRLAEAFNISTTLPAYSSRSDSWTMNGRHFAPGVLFFEGDLLITNGYYTNTIIATGNIDFASAGNAVVSLNWAGASGNPIDEASIQGVCENDHYGLHPSVFCSGTSFDYGVYEGLGNYGLMAGSCPESSPGACDAADYVGGDIAVAGPVYGAIKAGNLFSTSGDADVAGYITGLALGATSNSEKHSFGNSTTFDLSDLPDGYDPTAGKTDTADGGGEDPGGGASGVTLRWSRFR